MNFISHYYFDRAQTNSYQVLGAVLPDLVKNADKNWHLYPQKRAEQYETHPIFNHLLKGWKKHLQVDALFHSSGFFRQQTAQLKAHILPVLEKSSVRPSFLAHIGLELLLDHLLLTEKIVDVRLFYQHLANINTDEITAFLTTEHVEQPMIFTRFFEKFKQSEYLFSYQNLENISYALDRICQRLWNDPFSEDTKIALTEKLTAYKTELEPVFFNIFREIEIHLQA